MNTKTISLTIIIALIFLVPFCADARSPQGVYTVVLDAGHGGADRGVRVSLSRDEKDLTLEMVRDLKSTLEKSNGMTVILTRADDRDVPFAQRLAAGKADSTDLFLSLHVNAGFGKTASGYEMYFPGFNAPVANAPGTLNPIAGDMVRTKALNESVRLAKVVQTHLDRVLPRKSRDLREGPVRLQGMSSPALLLEIGFATNGKDKSELTDDAGRQRIVEALASAIREFCGIR